MAHPTRVAEVLLSVFYTCCHNRSDILFLVMHFKGGERSFAGLFLPFREPLQNAFRKAPMETFQEGIATVFGLYRGVVTNKPWFTAHGWELTAGSCIIEALSLERTGIRCRSTLLCQRFFKPFVIAMRSSSKHRLVQVKPPVFLWRYLVKIGWLTRR